jgi:hypothetical protein
MEQQQIEGYYGLVKPNTKLGRPGAMKNDVGFKYLTQQGFSSLLKFDAKRFKKFLIGKFSNDTHAALQVILPEYLVLALLMHTDRDVKEVVIAPNDNTARDFLGVCGYLCNGPRYIGTEIRESDVAEYILECTVERTANSWEHGFEQYIKRTQHFCLVQPLYDYAETSDEANAKVQHLKSLFPRGSYFCNCPMYWTRLHCPTPVYINDHGGFITPPLLQRIRQPYDGRDISRATAGRRRGPRPHAQRSASYLWESLGLPAHLNQPVLEFFAGLSKKILDTAANMKHFPSKVYSTKSEAIIHLLAGTFLGDMVFLEGTFDRRQIAGTWEELVARGFSNGRIFADEENYNAMFNPFPEGEDEVYPEQCTSFWINIPNVGITVCNVHVMSFLLACMHVSTPGTNGRLSDGILTLNSTITQFLMFYNSNRYVVTLSVFLTGFHQKYLHSASVTHHWFTEHQNMPVEERQLQLCNQVDAIIALIGVYQHPLHNAVPPRVSCVLVFGSTSLAILKMKTSRHTPHDIRYHVIIPQQLTYFIGSTKLSASTRTILIGNHVMRRFILRLIELEQRRLHDCYPAKLDAWIYQQTVYPEAGAAARSTNSEDEQVDPHDGTDHSIDDDGSDDDYGHSISQLANQT